MREHQHREHDLEQPVEHVREVVVEGLEDEQACPDGRCRRQNAGG